MLSKYRNAWLATALVAVLSVTLAACGGSPQPAAGPTTGTAPASAAAAVAEPVGDTVPAPAAAAVAGPAGESVPANTAAAVFDADAVVAAYEEVLANIYESVLPSVVRIEVAQKRGQEGQPRLERFGPRQVPEGEDEGPDEFLTRGEGSGFVWSDEGHVVTNHHVIDGTDRVTLIFADGSEYEATVLGSDPDSDLAVLKADLPPEQLHPVTLGDSGALRVGQLAVAIGAPFGQEFTMTRGIVSALGRNIQSGPRPFTNPEVIQTDAPINPGNSGGPVLDRQGQVIGINSQIISRSGASAGVGFSVPIDTAKRVIPELIANGTYEYAYLGISGITVRPRLTEAAGLPEDTRGVLVAEVRRDGPALKAGFRGGGETAQVDGAQVPVGGDVITAIDGTAIETMPDLVAYMVENNRPGDTVALQVLRDGREVTELEVTLGARPDAGDAPTRPS